MNADYVNGVRRFGAGGRLKDENGDAFNVSHRSDCLPADFQTDGRGNVTDSPLVWGKTCVARPERNIRNHFIGRLWTDKSGQSHMDVTACDRCSELSPGIYEACTKIVVERVESNAAIEASFETWIAGCGNDFGPNCFKGQIGRLWDLFLQAIIHHGGWTNCNDDQVKLEAIRLQREKSDNRNTSARAARQRTSMARRGAPTTVTTGYLLALNAERDRRADHIKVLSSLSGSTTRGMLWLTNLNSTSRDRIADVWSSRELLTRTGQKRTGRAIAEHMTLNGRSYGLSLQSLTARVYDDLKRIAKFEDDRAGVAIWTQWIDPSV